MKRFILYTLIAFTLLSCGGSEGRFRLKGEFEHLRQGEFYIYSNDGGTAGFDTIRIEDGQFDYETDLRDHAIYYLLYPNLSEQVIFGASGDVITIKGDARNLKSVEVKGSLAGPWTHLNDLKIKGIYINNVKLTRGASSLTRIASAAWGTDYAPSGQFEKMFNTDLGAGVGTGVAQIAGGQADGYNFFPQQDLSSPTTKEDVMKKSIHVIMEVEFDKKVGGSGPETGWLNVVALKDNTATNYITDFEAGKVYFIDLADIKDIMDVPVPPVTPDPDPETVSVDLTVSIGQWTVVQVKPEV